MTRRENRRRDAALACILSAGLISGTSVAAGSGTDPGARDLRAESPPLLDIVAPGELVSYALPSLPDGRREIVLLVTPGDRSARALPKEPSEAEKEDDEDRGDRLPPCPAEKLADEEPGPPMHLYQVNPNDPGDLILLRSDLPHDCTAADAIDLDGDGDDEILVMRRGEILLLEGRPHGEAAGAAPPLPLLRNPDLDWTALHPRAVRTPELDGQALVTVTRLGHLGLYGPREPGGRWELLAEVAVPLSGDLRSDGLRISSGIPEFLGRGIEETLFFATRPERVGNRRLRTLLIRLSPSGDSDIVESWAGLPFPERVLEQRFLMLDGRPVIFVTTMPADKLSIFVEKRIRLYSVERDRSRLGLAPLFAIQSRMNLWQESTPFLLDVDGDGHQDLVVGYWKGLTDDKVVLDAYLRDENGSFRGPPRTTSFNVKNGDRSYLGYGGDVNGDRVPDLLLRADGRLVYYPGLASTDGRRLVDRSPRTLPWEVAEAAAEQIVITVSTSGVDTEIPGGRNETPRFVDLNGDGLDEILMVRRGGEKEPGVLRLARP